MAEGTAPAPENAAAAGMFRKVPCRFCEKLFRYPSHRDEHERYVTAVVLLANGKKKKKQDTQYTELRLSHSDVLQGAHKGETICMYRTDLS